MGLRTHPGVGKEEVDPRPESGVRERKQRDLGRPARHVCSTECCDRGRCPVVADVSFRRGGPVGKGAHPALRDAMIVAPAAALRSAITTLQP